uniref:Uncharacterized protein n=2 Tax=Babesia bovis TaxID=5865 RepID=A7AQK6_BABBO|eukprot:XP_001610393.1 hypothetical protein [Babesia bovis T2Bo]
MEDNNNVVIPSALFLPSPGEEGFGTERRVLRLTYVETAKKKSSNVERSWEIPTYGSCIIGNESSQIDADTCSFQLDVPYSVDEYAPEAPPKGRFSLKRAMDSIDSTVEISSFINTGMLIKCLELIGPVNMDGTNNSSILIVSSCQKTPNCNTQADIQSGYLIIHELPINHLLHETSSENTTFKLTFRKPHFAKLCKLKKGTCVAFEWINPSAFYKVQTTIKDTGILMVILMDDGSISMCKIPLDFANYADNLSPETENKV